MSSCPSTERLHGLLADELSSAEEGAVARHVEGCLSCQEQLARIAATAESETWLHAKRPPRGLEDEEATIERLKRHPPTWLSIRPGPVETPPRSRSRALDLAPDALDWQRPAVPGYEILRELGRGGMGVVYQARQLGLHRTVALKMIRTGPHAGPKEIARFRAEAEAIARLQHPNIVQIYDVGEVAGWPFFAFEYVAGGNLTQYLDGTPQPVHPAAIMIETLARAAHAAHASGVVHRDLKPANVLLVVALEQPALGPTGGALAPEPLGERSWLRGQPKITDFGLALCVDDDAEAPGTRRLTVTGELLGTPSYMAPEQARTPHRPVGPLADVYALGAILYELLTGRPPFQGKTPLDTVLQVLYNDPVSVTRLQPGVPRDLETICHKCLQKDPRKRYESAQALADDLHRFVAGEPIQARPPSALYHWGKFAQRNKALVAALAGIVAALALGAVSAGLFALRAVEQKHLADQERDAALRQAYHARLAAAGAALDDDDVTAAALHLDHAPQRLRNWEWNHLHSRLDESSAVFRAPGKDRILLGSGRGEIRILSVGPDDLRVRGPDGEIALTVPRNGLSRVFRVWSTARETRIFGEDKAENLVVLDEAGEVRLRLAPQRGLGSADVAVSPDHSRFVARWAIGDGRPQCFGLYDVATGEEQTVFLGHTGYIFGLAFSPNGRQVASGSEDRTARLWDTAKGASVHKLDGHTDKVLSVAYSRDGAHVVTASADGTVRQWDAATGRPIGGPYRGHNHQVHSAIYCPDGSLIASGGYDGTIRLSRAANEEDVAVLHGHTSSVVQLAFSPDGRRLASAALDGTARVWEVGIGSSGGVLRGHETYVYPVVYSPDGQWIASGSWDKTVRLWDAQTGELSATLHHAGTVRALAFGPDGSWLVCGCEGDDHLQVWNVATGQRQRLIKSPGQAVLAVAVSPDGAWVAAADRNQRAAIIDVATGEECASFRTGAGGGFVEKRALAYSPDGRRLAVMGRDFRNIDIWDTQTHTCAIRLVGHTAAVYSVAFNSDGTRLVSAGSDRTVRIWDPATGRLLLTLAGHTDEVFAAVFHPNGTRVASAGRDRAIRLWDAATGAEVARLHGHTNYVFSLCFSPDGTTLASGSGDSTVRLWHTEPLAERFKTWRQDEALRPQAERLVERLFQELGDPLTAALSVRANRSVNGALRRHAQRVIWRQLAAPDS